MATKQIRFEQLVQRAGNPEVVTLWTAPERNRPFMKAVKENRVLTVVQEPASTRKDFGRIGFHQNAHASYLVFPRSLPSDRDSRVIGIKYDLVRQAIPRDPVSPKERPAPGSRAQRKSQARDFDVVIRRTAVLETSVRVSGRTESQARRDAVASARRLPFDIAKAVLREDVMSVQ
jgi:hypothetical protein